MKKLRCKNVKLFTFSVLCICTCITLLNYTWRIKSFQMILRRQKLQPMDHGQKTGRSDILPFNLKLILKKKLGCHDRPLIMEKIQYAEYWLLRNYFRGHQSIKMGCAESITYTTNGDYTFFGNVANVIVRWLAPISFAVFAPGYDFNVTLDSIQYIRNCLPESHLIRDFVTFHVYFPKDHLPWFVPPDESEALRWPFDCITMPAPYDHVNRSQMYRTIKDLLYPINVGRNIAKRASNTYFNLASDVELYPSIGFVAKFLQMINNNVTLRPNDQLPRVFPLPVFELEHNAIIPDNKQELMNLLQAKMAFPFHWKICRRCHRVPGYEQWLKANDTGSMQVIGVSKREDSYAIWEPFYVGDNQEPPFDERISWEGQSNKRIQNYAMCLLDYEYLVLHPAFLVHAPGVKHFNKKDPRLKYVPATNKLINNQIKKEYQNLYGRNKKCRV